MGHASSKDLYVRGLKRLLAARESRVSREQLEKFLEFVKKVCPWFPEEGTVSLETWEKVGKQLQDYYAVHGPQQVPVETFGLWTLIRDCLDLKREGCRLEKVKQAGNEEIPSSAASPAAEERQGEGAAKLLEGVLKDTEPVCQEAPMESWEELDPQNQEEIEGEAAKYDRNKYPPLVAIAQGGRQPAGTTLSLTDQIKMIQGQLIELKVAADRGNCPRSPQIPFRDQWNPRGKGPPTANPSAAASGLGSAC